MTEMKAEVPMAELLGYAPELRSITGGQGDYTMEFLRYEEVPGHLVSKVLDGRRGSRHAFEDALVDLVAAACAKAGRDGDAPAPDEP